MTTEKPSSPFDGPELEPCDLPDGTDETGISKWFSELTEEGLVAVSLIAVLIMTAIGLLVFRLIFGESIWAV